MIAAYGQDDRVCAYTSLMALLNANTSRKTMVTMFVDKEEIGSVGNVLFFEVFWSSLRKGSFKLLKLSFAVDKFFCV